MGLPSAFLQGGRFTEQRLAGSQTDRRPHEGNLVRGEFMANRKILESSGEGWKEKHLQGRALRSFYWAGVRKIHLYAGQLFFGRPRKRKRSWGRRSSFVGIRER